MIYILTYCQSINLELLNCDLPKHTQSYEWIYESLKLSPLNIKHVTGCLYIHDFAIFSMYFPMNIIVSPFCLFAVF